MQVVALALRGIRLRDHLRLAAAGRHRHQARWRRRPCAKTMMSSGPQLAPRGGALTAQIGIDGPAGDRHFPELGRRLKEANPLAVGRKERRARAGDAADGLGVETIDGADDQGAIGRHVRDVRAVGRNGDDAIRRRVEGERRGRGRHERESHRLRGRRRRPAHDRPRADRRERRRRRDAAHPRSPVDAGGGGAGAAAWHAAGRRRLAESGAPDCSRASSMRASPMSRRRVFTSRSRQRSSSRFSRGGVVARQRGPLHLLPQHGRERVRDVLALERPLAGQHLVQDDAERPDVGASIDGLALRLLGRHVGGRAEDHAELRRARGQRRRVHGAEPTRSTRPRPAPWRGRSPAPSPCRRPSP